MLAKKLLLLTTAVLALGVTSASCAGGDDDDDDTYTLSSGEYDLEIDAVAANTCFPQDLLNLIVGVAFGVDIVSTNGTSFLLVTPEEIQAFLPPVEGTIDGNDISAAGNVQGVPLGTAGCMMNISATAIGELTANDEFVADLDADLEVPASAAADCAPYVGEDLPIESPFPIPFPTLTNTSSGTCNVLLETNGFLP